MPKPRGASVPRMIGPEELARILDVTRKLAAPFDLAAMLSEVVDAAKGVLDADGASIWLYEREVEELVLRVSTGMEPVRVPADRGIVGECVRTRVVINVPDCYADPRFNRDVDKASGYRTRCMLTLPLVGSDDTLVGVLQVLNKNNGTFDIHDESVATALAAQCAVALQRVQMTEALVAGERLRQEISVAREVQQSTLPTVMPQVSGYDVFGSFHPADETGGDTFDLSLLPDGRLFLMMGDATGHGIGPALSVTQMHAMLRMAMRLGAGLGDAYRNVNNQLASDLPPERFVTAFLGLLDTRTHKLEYYSPGQGPILHFRRATGEIERSLPTSFPLGAFPVQEAKPPRSVRIEPGDVVALVSDGIFEWPNAQGAEFGVERVEALLREHQGTPMKELAERIRRDAIRFGAAQADDVTLLLLCRGEDANDLAGGESGERVNVALPRSLAGLEPAVAAVGAFWKHHRLPQADRNPVDFAIEEIFTNVVKYGRPGQTPVTLLLEREANGVLVTLIDPDSADFDPTRKRVVDLNAPLEARQPGGLGLPLIHRLVEDFAYQHQDGESRISFRKRFKTQTGS